MIRLVRGCLLVILGLVGAVVVVYLLHGLAGRGDVKRAEAQARADLDAALPAARAQAVADRDAARATRSGPPSYAWQEVVCDLDSDDAGWMVQSYVQECRVRSVDLYPGAGVVPLSLQDPTTARTRVLDGDRPDDLDLRDWDAVVSWTPVSRSDLGCSPWGLLFCSQPVDHAEL